MNVLFGAARFTRLSYIIVSVFVVAATLTVPGVITAPPSLAAAGDIGFAGPSFSGVTAPTGEKPESKLWWNDGRWWASMYHPASGTWHIFYLNGSASPKSWVDTGTVLDNRVNTRADTLWANGKLYVASHVKASSNTSAAPGQPARLYQYSYNATSKSYSLDAGFPTKISDYSSETITLDRDGSGRLWVTWTQGQAVYVNYTTTGGQWAGAAKLPGANATGLNADDISTLATFGGKTGVLWSNQSTSKVYFTWRNSGDAVTTWQPTIAVTLPGDNQADDHLNIKSFEGTPGGQIFAVIKTSLDATGPGTAPQIVVLSRNPGSGLTESQRWSRATFGTVSDCHTRPILVLDDTNKRVHVYATAPNSGCPFPGSAGTIFEKTSPMSSLSFPSGRGTPVMKDVASSNLNNVSASKQTTNSTTGIVLLASNDTTGRYWFSDQSLGTPPPPATVTAGASATGSSGTAVGTVTIAKPSGTTAGDVLVASFTADNAPTAQPPAGWTALASPLTVPGATQFTYYRVVSAADASTGSWSWPLNTAQKWSGGISRYIGVDNATPIDVPVITKIDTSGSATAISATAPIGRAGSLLIGGIGINSANTVVGAPSGWTQRWASAGGQSTAQASTGAASGTQTWTLASAQYGSIWMTALRPA